MADWELVVGLETHVELDTRTKLFCGCARVFGAPPNQSVCPVCMGLPGALPTLNRQAVRLAAVAGLALGCRVRPRSRFDRKHYFYPDLPKGYQITQADEPLCEDGFLTVTTEAGERRVRIERIHLEEDAGKLTHDERGTLLDMNRCGAPLIEIVTGPDFRSAREAAEYLRQLRAVLVDCGVSRCRMNEGELRCDVNLSLRLRGSETLGQRTEIKNLNSFQSVERAIAAEAARQRALLERGEAVRRQTLRFDQRTGGVAVMRGKESGADYRFMPEPDLPDVLLTEAELDALRGALPELPAARRARLAAYGLPPAQTAALARDAATAAYFARAAGDRPQAVANLLLGELAALTAELDDGARLCVPPEDVGALAGLLAERRVNSTTGKRILRAMLDAALAGGRAEPEAYARENGLFLIADEAALRALCRRAMDENPALVAKVRAGQRNVLQALLGKAMGLCGGLADPEALRRALEALLGENPA